MSFLFTFPFLIALLVLVVLLVVIALLSLVLLVLTGSLSESGVLKSPILIRNGSSGSSLKAT